MRPTLAQCGSLQLRAERWLRVGLRGAGLQWQLQLLIILISCLIICCFPFLVLRHFTRDGVGAQLLPGGGWLPNRQTGIIQYQAILNAHVPLRLTQRWQTAIQANRPGILHNSRWLRLHSLE